MYSTNSFEIKSQTNNQRWTFRADNLESYINEKNADVPEYVIKTTPKENSATYTIVNARFPNQTLPAFFSELNRFLDEDSVRWKELYLKEKNDQGTDPTDAYLEHFFSWYFRTQSYVGCTNRLLGIPVKNISTEKFEEVKPVTIRLTLKSESQFAEIGGVIGDWLQKLGQAEFTTKISNKAWDYSEIAAVNHDRATKYRIAPKIITTKPTDAIWDELQSTFRNCFLDIKLTPNNSEEDFDKKYADFIKLLERPRSKIKAKQFRDVMEKITGIHLAIGRTSAFEMLGVPNHGIRIIASNGTPTAHTLSVVSTSSTWYLETIHMIINVDATFNLGKRHLVDNHLVSRIQSFFEACYPVLVNISKLFVERDTDPPGEDPLPDVVESKKLRRKNIPFRRFPNDENTLIGLFSTILGRLDQEFSVYGYFGKARYDGKFCWTAK